VWVAGPNRGFGVLDIGRLCCVRHGVGACGLGGLGCGLASGVYYMGCLHHGPLDGCGTFGMFRGGRFGCGWCCTFFGTFARNVVSSESTSAAVRYSSILIVRDVSDMDEITTISPWSSTLA
jgi:hypothetical protein